MATVQPRAKAFFSFRRIMFNLSLLQLIFVVSALAQRCTRTRAVPVQEQPVKKVHVLRRIPATCSNWDKAWTWLTKKECGTKYRLDYVTVPTRETTEYRLEYVCCDGDTACKEAENVKSGGFDTSDEKFLALVLGSTAACIVLVIIIFAITFYTKKTRCPNLCDPKNHTYATTGRDESADGNDVEKFHNQEDGDSESEHKGCGDSDYAEIGDPTLPRYTDIFKDPGDHVEEVEGEDPFQRATAPPMYSEVPPNRVYANTNGGAVRSAPLLQSSSGGPEKLQLQGASVVVECEGGKGGKGGEAGPDGPQKVSASPVRGGSGGEPSYCNVKNKKEGKKKKKGGNSASNEKSGSAQNRREKCENEPIYKSVNKRSKPLTVDNLVKSSSASDTIGSSTEATTKRQKRRSAPVSEASVTVVQTQAASAAPGSTTTPSNVNSNVCKVIQEAPPPLPPRKYEEKTRGGKSKESKQNELKVHKSKGSSKRNNKSCHYENKQDLANSEEVIDLTTTTKPKSSTTSTNKSRPSKPSTVSVETTDNAPIIVEPPVAVEDNKSAMDQTPPVSPSAGSVLSYSRSASSGLNSIDLAEDDEAGEEDEDEEMVEAGERDSLLQSPSCHSDCDPGCEHCSSRDLEYFQLYDQPSVGGRSSDAEEDGDNLSLHVYQSLREVADKTSIDLDTYSTGSVSPTKSVYMNGAVIVSTNSRNVKSPVHHV